MLSHHHLTFSSLNYSHYMTRMSHSSGNTCPIDSRGRASPPGEASSGEFEFLVRNRDDGHSLTEMKLVQRLPVILVNVH